MWMTDRNEAGTDARIVGMISRLSSLIEPLCIVQSVAEGQSSGPLQRGIQGVVR